MEEFCHVDRPMTLSFEIYGKAKERKNKQTDRGRRTNKHTKVKKQTNAQRQKEKQTHRDGGKNRRTEAYN